MYDLIIIGAGPAGLSAAVYAMRAGLKTIVVDKSPVSGGQVLTTYEVDNYPGLPGIMGADLGMKMREHADKLGAAFMQACVISVHLADEIKRVETDQGTLEAGCVIIAAGASHALLQVPGEKKLTGTGVSYCAACDGAFFRNRSVAVVGGGDVAVEDAIVLAGICKKVYLIHRRNQLRAEKILQNQVLKIDNVEILWNCVATQIQGTERVTGITVRNVQDDTEREIEVQGVFIAVGMRPESELFREEIEMDENGWLVAGEDGKTNLPGVFAAGDIRTKKLRQIITAAADGANCVFSALEYLMIGK